MNSNEIKIVDLTKSHSGKWFEIGTLCTNDPNEKLEIVAKVIDLKGALAYAEWYKTHIVGYHTIVIR
jgi:intein-encoded DNA endonuclease-like protein